MVWIRVRILKIAVLRLNIACREIDPGPVRSRSVPDASAKAPCTYGLEMKIRIDVSVCKVHGDDAPDLYGVLTALDAGVGLGSVNENRRIVQCLVERVLVARG